MQKCAIEKLVHVFVFFLKENREKYLEKRKTNIKKIVLALAMKPNL